MNKILSYVRRCVEDYDMIQPGDRIAQMSILPVFQAELEWTDTLDQTDRGSGGFGSTGK